MTMNRFTRNTIGLAFVFSLTLFSAANGVEPRQVEWLLFSDPPIKNPVPPEVPTTGRSIVPVFDATAFASLNDSGKNSVIDEMFTFIEDKQLYRQIEPVGEAVIPAGFVEPLISAASSQPDRSATKRKMLSVLLYCPAESRALEIWDAGKNDPMIRPLIEKKLIDWKSDVAAADWRAIIADPASLGPLVAGATRGLGAVGEASDAEAIRPWLGVHQGDHVRIAAAEAISKLTPDQNLELAQAAWDSEKKSTDITDSLVAATLLQYDKSIEAGKVLAQIVQARIDGSHELAFQTLFKLQPRAAAKLAFQMIEDGNSSVRRQCIPFIGLSRRPDNLKALFGALNDSIPENRSLALRQILKAADDASLRPTLTKAFQVKLTDENWRTVEQAILGSVTLENKSVVPVLIKLLDHPNASVRITAAWGIKEMGEDPRVIGLVDQRVRKMYERHQAKDPLDPYTLYDADNNQLLAQLIEILGKHRREESLDIVQELTGRFNSLGDLGRSCSIWSLAKIRENNPTGEMVKNAQTIVKSLETRDPEPWLVAYAALLSLGRFQDDSLVSKVETLKDTIEGDLNMGAAAEWMLNRVQSPGNAPIQ